MYSVRRPNAPPEGYRSLSLEQVQKADLELSKGAMRMTHEGTRPTASGQRPLEDAILVLKDLPEVRLFLQPLQGAFGSWIILGPGSLRCKAQFLPIHLFGM